MAAQASTPDRAAVVLLSGGLDSAVALAIARNQGFACHALSFDYGQRHRIELDAARSIALSMRVVRHVVATIDLRVFGASALTANIDVPKNRGPARREHANAQGADIPITYVPARNLIFLAHAVALAEVSRAQDIFIGVNAVDYSGYPDCRPEFIDAFARCARLATKAGVEGANLRIQTPLIGLTKSEIIRQGSTLGVDFALTHSCYDPDSAGRACGACDSCRIRKIGFSEASLPDPTRYATARPR